MALQITILERMFEEKGYGFDPETDGFYPSTLPSFPEQPASSRELNRSVYEAFSALQQAHVALADAVTDWDMGDAWAVDGALNASAWLRNKLGVSNGSANSMLTFARRTSILAPSVREAVREGVLSTDKANQILYCFTKKRAEHVDRDVDTLIRSASQLTVNQTRFMMINWAATVDAEIESASDDIEPEDATIKNELFISETIDGMTVMQGQFDAEVGETIRTAIDLARRLENGTLDEIDKPTDHEDIETDSNDRAIADEKPVDERNYAEQRADALGLIARFFLDHHNGLGTNAGERPRTNQHRLEHTARPQRWNGRNPTRQHRIDPRNGPTNLLRRQNRSDNHPWYLGNLRRWQTHPCHPSTHCQSRPQTRQMLSIPRL
jgi:Domain of unknown function (DUF222)